jgi:hypothetical protein
VVQRSTVNRGKVAKLMRYEIIPVANQNQASHSLLQFHQKPALLSILNSFHGMRMTMEIGECGVWLVGGDLFGNEYWKRRGGVRRVA